MSTNAQGDWFGEDAFVPQGSAGTQPQPTTTNVPPMPTLPAQGQPFPTQPVQQQPVEQLSLSTRQGRVPVRKDLSPPPEEPKKHRFMNLFKVCISLLPHSLFLRSRFMTMRMI